MGYLEEFTPDLPSFYEATKKFHTGEMTVNEYKGFSGGFGSYAQRGAQTHMLRLRMTGGRMDKRMLEGIVNICATFDIKRMKLTTCESVQMHDLTEEQVCGSILPAWQAGMITRGGGGDFPRNVMCSPLSGVQTDEHFDVMPYAQAAGEYLLGFIHGPKFPRKLKVCFSNSAANVTHATIRDLGFAANADGTFDIYAAGGMGNNARVGVKVGDHVAPAKILYYIKAMVETFKAHGNYENRGRARTRYLQIDMGVDAFLAAYNEKLAEAMANEKLDLEGDMTQPVTKTGTPSTDDAFLSNPRVYAQKQSGLYAVFYQPVGGIFTPEAAGAIYNAIKDVDAAEVRVTPTEGLYVINLTEAEAKAVLAATPESALSLFETSSACIGAATCQVGIGDSQALLKACVEEVRKHNFANGVLPRIHISGCPSSCATHQIAAIGFRGGMKKTEEGSKPAFAISVGGCDLQGREKLAESGESILVEKIPALLVEIGETVTKAGTTYDQWIINNEAALQEIIAKYI